jgi:catechol 2,3-dioxygenase-like lactoylglutathione lyase family enzyme
MHLGAFSVCLNVQDIAASRAFYEKLGFTPVMGDADQGWLIMRNALTTLGLFRGMLETTTLTFNPGWDAEANELGSFTDVREIQRELKAAGLQLDSEVDESGQGPGSLVLHDPDGNPILIDQHV